MLVRITKRHVPKDLDSAVSSLDEQSITEHLRKTQRGLDMMLKWKTDRTISARVDILNKFTQDAVILIKYAKKWNDKELMSMAESLDNDLLHHADATLQQDSFEWGYRYLRAAEKIGLSTEEVRASIKKWKLEGMGERLMKRYGF
ncbi:MAG TPA: hypothetical protein VND15_02935 [Candidatus Acidoferrales bacterium]|nr:hypothetical protein [Candidatus Acidoferrales bacterium]